MPVLVVAFSCVLSYYLSTKADFILIMSLAEIWGYSRLKVEAIFEVVEDAVGTGSQDMWGLCLVFSPPLV